jgi:hypothetical protein
MTTLLQPALTPDEWRHRRAGAVSVDAVGDETHVVITDPDGQLVSVSGADALHALAALANDALPNDEARKLTWTDLVVISMLVERLDRRHSHTTRLTSLAAGLYAKLAALLPPP